MDYIQAIKLVRGRADRVTFSLNGGSFCLDDLGVGPIEFLSQAESDFSHGGKLSNINSLTNSKRAVVAQMDQLLVSLGFNSFRWNVPKKTEKLRELGVLAPSVLRKIIDSRNLLEHEYKCPSKEEAESFLDIAALFVLGTAASFHPFPDELQMSFFDGDIFVSQIDMAIKKGEGAPIFHGYGYRVDPSFERELIVEFGVPNSSPLFGVLTKTCLALELRYREQEQADELRSLLYELAGVGQ